VDESKKKTIDARVTTAEPRPKEALKLAPPAVGEAKESTASSTTNPLQRADSTASSSSGGGGGGPNAVPANGPQVRGVKQGGSFWQLLANGSVRAANEPDADVVGDVKKVPHKSTSRVPFKVCARNSCFDGE
jgi:hypothetical protein